MKQSVKELAKQQVFRQLVNAFSHQGRRIDLATNFELPTYWPYFSGTYEVMTTLLDQSSCFHILGEGRQEMFDFCLQTGAVQAEVEQADFIMIPQKEMVNDITILNRVKIGTLYDPHQSATLIIECDGLDEEGSFQVKGPGVREVQSFGVKCQWDWLTVFEKANEEFPLGIDLLFIDGKEHLLALTRTGKLLRGDA